MYLNYIYYDYFIILLLLNYLGLYQVINLMLVLCMAYVDKYFYGFLMLLLMLLLMLISLLGLEILEYFLSIVLMVIYYFRFVILQFFIYLTFNKLYSIYLIANPNIISHSPYYSYSLSISFLHHYYYYYYRQPPT